MTALQTITNTPSVAKRQAKWIARQAYGFWSDSASQCNSALARERHRKQFLAYAKEAIELLGVEVVAKGWSDSYWQKIIREIGRDGEMAAWGGNCRCLLCEIFT